MRKYLQSRMLQPSSFITASSDRYCSMMEVATGPRIVLEFQGCKKEDFLAWLLKGIQIELAACAKYPEEAVALKAVDEETGEIAAYAVWGWSARVCNLFFNSCRQSYLLLNPLPQSSI